MVAGAGGGHYNTGGAGGGLQGYTGYSHPIVPYRGYGGTQTAGGNGSKQQGGFGFGGTNGAYSDGHVGGSGGGGYYGGGGSIWHSGGGGGSSFISGHEGCLAVDETGTPTNTNIHYSAITFTDTVMIDGNGYEWTTQRGSYTKMEDPDGNYVDGKSGNGYARVTLLEDPSQNNLIKEIQINKGTITPEVNYDDTEYTIQLDKEETEITIYGVVDDKTATIEGNGTYKIPAGETKIGLTVTAQNGDIREYVITVTREASTNAKPTSIHIDGLIESIININPEKYGILVPAEFDVNTHEYSMVVPSRLKKLNFIVEKGNYYQTVTGDGLITLNAGMNDIQIKVTSEDGNNVETYTYHIERDMSGNCMLSDLQITNIEDSIEFDQDILEYYLIVPNNIDHLDINAIPEVSTITPIIIGNTKLDTGLNDVYIINNAANGEQLVYIIHVYRMMSGNTFLSNLQVKSGSEVLEMLPEYNKILDTYTIHVPNKIDNIDIIATPEVRTTVVTGSGNKNLSTGVNIFNIITTAEDGSQDSYTISIERDKSANNYLSSLEIIGETMSPEFNKETLEYNVEVEAEVNKLWIQTIQEDETARVDIIGNANFKAGINVVTIRVTAENGDVREYKINVNKKKSDNNYLTSISTNYGTLDSEFDKETLEYTIEVENEVQKINVSAIRENLLSAITGTGTYALQVGSNNISISVMSESGLIRNYQLDIIRKLNSNTKIKDFENLSATKADENTYVINVLNEINTINLKAIPEAATTTVEGNGNINLDVGENRKTITLTAEDGSSKEYTIIINRAKSSNANLKYLFITESEYTPKLSDNITEYNTKILFGVTSLTMDIKTQDEGATYEVIGNENFVAGVNKVYINVTASDGISKKQYLINAFVQGENIGSNYLFVLTVNRGTLTPAFNKEIQLYRVEVPYESETIDIGAIAEDSVAIINGIGQYNLNVGENDIAVKVTSSDGIERTYQLKVTRKESTETRLQSLEVKEHTINPEFDSDETNYYLETALTKLDLSAVTYDSRATYTIIGNEELQKGTNKIIIRVTAPNGIDTRDYNINVTRTVSYNNNLSDLQVVGYSLTPEFNKSTSVYELNVDTSVNNIEIQATPEESFATVTGTGIIALNSGKNVCNVNVVSEAGTLKTYTIIINKGKSDNNYLEKIITSEGVLSPVFDKETNDYTINVNYEINSLEINAYLEDNTASVSGDGVKKLVVGENKVNIVVTSESGLVRTYTITINRAKAISALLEKLEIMGYSISPKFDSNVFNYSAVVNNEITSLDLDIKTLDDDAIYQVTGNGDFKVGLNEVKITVLSSDGVTTEEYIISVNRQMYSNNFLSYILPSKGTLSPTFNKQTTNYTIVVDSDVDSIDISAEPEDANSSLTGDGNYSLEKGDNKVEIVVTSALGVKRTYTINVVRNKNNNNYLSKLEVKNGSTLEEFTPTFNRETLEYSLDVIEGTSRLQIIAEAEDSLAQVSGSGYVAINSGDNKFEISVTAEDGTVRKYIINVNRAKSNNNHLTELIPSVGVMSPGFSYDGTDYQVTVGNADALLSFDYNTENRYAIVSGTGEQIIPDGESHRQIIVTAEDGSTRTYNITVIKNRTDDARLQRLEVNGYTLNETFNEDKYVYTMNVANEVTKLNASSIIAEAKYDTSTIFLDGDLELSTKKENVFNIKVLAEDGFTTQTYKIKVIRAKNNNNNLSSLSVRLGETIYILDPVFDKDTLSYIVNVPEGTNNAEILATAENAEATISGAGMKDIIVGENNFNIVVNAENGETKTYKIKIIRTPNANKKLASLEPSIGTLKPSFDPNILEYSVEVENEDYYISFNATPDSYLATVSGTEETYIEDGENIRNIVVTAENGDIRTYKVKVIKNRTNDPRLKNLEIKSYTFDQEFDPDVYEYTLTVPNDKFELSPNEIVAKAKYEDSEIEYTPTIALSVLELNTYEVKVTSPDGTKTATYKIEITRKKSSDSRLESLSVTGYRIKETFDSDILEYTVLVPKGTTTFDASRVVPVPKDQYATIVMSDGFDMSENKVFEITLTSHDETTTTTYKLKPEYEKSNNAYLKSLTIDGGLISPEFDRNLTTYDVHMTSRQKTLTISAETEDDAAVITEGVGTFEINELEKQILILVQAEDESFRIYIINVTKDEKTDTVVTGNVETDNDSDIHNATINIFKGNDLMYEGMTAEDGSYEIYVSPDKYDIVLSKPGFLTMTIKDVTFQSVNHEIELERYVLSPGDVVETGEVEIDDLVDFNENIGIIITDANKAEKEKYDFNEDGVIDDKDRRLLIANYGKIAQTVIWTDPSSGTTPTNEIQTQDLSENYTAINNDIIESEENKDTLILPMSCDYTITSQYGEREDPFGGETKFHKGIDIVGDWHTNILAVSDGKVVFAGVQSGYGNCVEIIHIVNGETVYSFYAHLSQINVLVGQHVSQGDVIGLEGGAESDPNHGSSTGHHLHFELRDKTNVSGTLNPNDFIQF